MCALTIQLDPVDLTNRAVDFRTRERPAYKRIQLGNTSLLNFAERADSGRSGAIKRWIRCEQALDQADQTRCLAAARLLDGRGRRRRGADRAVVRVLGLDPLAVLALAADLVLKPGG